MEMCKYITNNKELLINIAKECGYEIVGVKNPWSPSARGKFCITLGASTTQKARDLLDNAWSMLIDKMPDSMFLLSAYSTMDVYYNYEVIYEEEA